MKSNLKHTKGPWEVYEDDFRCHNGIESQSAGTSIVVFGEEIGVRGETIEEQKANTRLISCAPEMLDALIMAYRSLINERKAQNGRGYHYTIETLGNIIERATGMTIEEVSK
jgi:hypothetical protein